MDTALGGLCAFISARSMIPTPLFPTDTGIMKNGLPGLMSPTVCHAIAAKASTAKSHTVTAPRPKALRPERRAQRRNQP